ncbi:flagellar hook assembly protein FlgD [Swingsia samuiensis]|uniref:Basal-body rod modification protein FlgD n=1 Tax=Swingsia samuiensis TaxID=1293412 RepID=A0A4Y6UJW8_9PROT|nr:flagellar hook assembly protein FlgD [Swingsia samuiensis]QDH17354.1 flagellar hook assembly protein FlgD [Swingsia samuiensis]
MTSIIRNQLHGSIVDTAVSAARKKEISSNASSNTQKTTNLGNSALSSLTGNFNQFLTLLTAQLQHQDPSNPMNTDSFTSELAQFAGVQQAVQTNNHLSSLISATQDTQMTSSVAMLGKKATATTSVLPLQQSSANVHFRADQAGTVAIAVTDASGKIVKTTELQVQAGEHSWHWDGVGNDGQLAQNGQYSIAIEESKNGDSIDLPTQTTGTITGVDKASGGIKVKMGESEVALGSISEFSNE